MKRRFLSILLALVLVLSFSLVTAVPAAGADTLNVVPFVLEATGGATATAAWSTSANHTGSWGVNIGTDTDGTDVGRVILAWNQNLSTITNMAYWYKLQAGNGAANWDSGPYVVLALDTDSNSSADTWVVHHMFAMSPGLDTTWLKWELSDGPIASQYMVTGNGTAMWLVAGATTIANASWAEVVTQFGSDTVLEIKIAVGDWASSIETRHYVDDIAINGTTYYGKIQDAIDTATATGDTISVAAGTYTEQVYINEENLTVESTAGAATTIIDGTGVTDANLIPGHGGLVWLQKDGITLEGFTVRDYPVGWGNGGAVYLQGWNGTTVDDITGCTITENTITVANDNGIVVEGAADSNTISNNTITVSTGGGVGIIMAGKAGNDTTGNQITGNTITSIATKYGISLNTDSAPNQRNFPGTVISGNTISGDGNGIGLFYATGNATSHIVIQNNTISGLSTSDGEGIELYHGAYTDILRNTLQSNVTGVQVKETGSTNVVVNYNDLSGNSAYGLETANLPVTLLDAEYNWWGATTGPDDDGSKNPYYVQAATWAGNCSTGVDFTPWMIHTSLASGWNIYSTPIASGTSTDTINEALDFWGTDSTKVTGVYYFDSSASPQIFRVATSLTPQVPVYLNMSSSANISVLMSTSNTAPPAMTMYQGWNLVGPAQMYPMTEVSTMISAYQGTGQANLVGYTQIISPSIGNQAAAWTYIRDVGTAKNMLPTEGYWVYMANQGTLGGFTYTPITPLP